MALSNSQYDEIIRKYDARQLRNQHLLEERTKDAYDKIPQLGKSMTPSLPALWMLPVVCSTAIRQPRTVLSRELRTTVQKSLHF